MKIWSDLFGNPVELLSFAFGPLLIAGAFFLATANTIDNVAAVYQFDAYNCKIAFCTSLGFLGTVWSQGRK